MKRYILKNREGALSVAMREGLPLCMLIAANPDADWRAGSCINIPSADFCAKCTDILSGSTLAEMSENLGIPMRLILQANSVSHPSELSGRTGIMIPRIPRGTQMYTLRGAETFSDIASRFGISEYALKTANPGVTGTYAGLQILIPPK